MAERSFFSWLRPWVVPAAAIVGFEWYARRAAALGSEALAPPSAAVRAFAGAAMDGSLWEATGFTIGTAALDGALVHRAPLSGQLAAALDAAAGPARAS